MATAAIARDRLKVAVALDQHAAQSVPAPIKARAHEVTRPSRQRKLARDWGSGNNIVGMDARQLRDQARHLERDLDLADNALNILVQNTVGSGIDVLSAPRLPGQPIVRELALQLDDLWDRWWDAPEVTGRHDYGASQQLLFRTRCRDGESFYQHLLGHVPYLEHGSEVPYSIELIEPDLIPLDFTDPSRRILQGAERNAWGRVIAWHIYKNHPGDAFGLSTDTKRVDASVIGQVANIKRLHQVRGLSVFASAMSRFEDVKDYEESERIAAKVAASLTAAITKDKDVSPGAGSPFAAQALVQDGIPMRDLRMAPGMIFDDLLPGEDIAMIASDRPNPGAATWRKEQLRAAAGGIGVSYSSLSLDYNGTYSAQRQELVEKWGGYLILAEEFIAQAVRKHRLQFVHACVLAGLVRLPHGWNLRHLAASTYVRPVMPWIDPLKEAYARGEAEDRGWVSPQQNTLQYGNNPNDVMTQTADWRRLREANDLGADEQASPAQTEARAQVRASVVQEMLKSRS